MRQDVATNDSPAGAEFRPVHAHPQKREQPSACSEIGVHTTLLTPSMCDITRHLDAT